MSLSKEAHKTHSQNIANANTPFYRRKQFKFQGALLNAMREGSAEAYSAVEGCLERPNNTSIRNNGNNVDIDMEIVDMSDNKMFYDSLVDIYSNRSKGIAHAIKGGR